MPIRINHKAKSQLTNYCVERVGMRHELLIMGRHSYACELFLHWEGERCRATVGHFSSIAQGVHFFLGSEHRTDWATTYPFTHLPIEWEDLRVLSGHPMTRGDIVVGSDVWIGYGVMIRSGVSIGDGAVIGMGSIVTRDVPPYAIVAGNPARFIRWRFSEAVIEKLLSLHWWDFPDEVIRKAAPLLCSPMNSVEDCDRLMEVFSSIK